MIRLVDKIYDQRGAERAESLAMLIRQLAELSSQLREEDKKEGTKNVQDQTK